MSVPENIKNTWKMDIYMKYVIMLMVIDIMKID